MNIYRLIALLLLPLALLGAGCATTPVTEVNTWRDAQFSLSATNSIALTDRPHPTPEDAALGQLLVDEMKHAGFTITSADRADYLLTYVTDNFTETKPYLRTLPQESMMSGRPLTPQTTAQIVNTPYMPSTETTLDSFVFHSKEITLYVYTNPQTQPGGLRVAWQGAITAGQSVTEERERILIRTLLGYFGKAHGGAVDITQ